jgi:hypothetical protein
MHRCMTYPDLQGKPQDQRVAICESLWAKRRAGGGKVLPVPRSLSTRSYKFAPGLRALDAITPKEPTFDTGRMSATAVLSTTALDREGDVLEVAGIWTDNHRTNPIAMLDHGVYWPLPIGKTVDPDGNYTVAIDPDAGECIETTFFSQSCPVAEQIYHLAVEGILRGNSIGYRPIEAKRLPPDAAQGTKPGLHILRCELIEATRCGIPCKPEAGRATLSRDRICGKSIAPAVKHLLFPYAAPKTVWSPGATLPGTQSAAGESNPEGERAMSQKHAGKNADDPAAYDEDAMAGASAAQADEPTETGAEEPYGAELVRDVHADLVGIVERYTAALKRLENEKVKPKLLDLMDDLDAVVCDLEEVFKAAYPDLDQLTTDAGDEDEPAETNSGKSATGKPTRQAKTPTVEQKRLIKSQCSAVREAADFLAEHKDSANLDRKEKAAVAYHAKSLDEVARQGESVGGEDEDLNEADRKALLALKRSIARKERLLSRLVAR